MISNSGRSFRTAIILVILTVMALVGALIVQYRSLNESAFNISRAQDVITRINQVMILTLDNETGARGFVVTGDSSFLKPVEESKSGGRAVTRALRRLIANNESQLERLNEIERTFEARTAFSDSMVMLRRDFGLPAASALVMTKRGKRITDRLRNLSGDMIVAENKLLDERKQVATTFSTRMDWLIALIITFVLTALILYLRNARKDLAERESSEQRVRTILDSAPDAMIIVDDNNAISLLNSQTEKIFRYTRSQLLGQGLGLIFPNDVVRRLMAARRTSSGEQNYQQLEAVGRTSGNTEIPIEIRQVAFSAGNEKIVAISIRDITERKMAEDKLAYQAKLIEDISDAVIGTDRDFIVRSWNRAAEQLFGYNAEEIIGKRFGDIIVSMMPTETASENRRQLLEEGTFTGESTYLKKNGASLPIFLSVTTIYDAMGNTQGFVTVCRDITARKKVEEQMAYLASLTEQSSDAIISMDKHGKVKTWNRGALLLYGYRADEVVGRSFSSISKSRFPDEYDQAAIDGLQRDGFLRVEARHFTKGGKPVDVIKSITPIRNSLNEVTEFVLVISDITERKLAETQVREFNEQLAAEVKRKTAELTSIFERITDGFIAFDNQWNITYLNRKGAELLQVNENSVGKNFSEIFRTESAAHFLIEARKAMEHHNQQFVFEYNPDRATWLENHLYPSAEGLSVFFRDVTKERQATQRLLESTEQLSQSERKYKLLFENNPMPMWMLDRKERKIVDVNQAAISHYRYTREEFLAQDPNKMRPQGEEQRFIEEMKEVVPGVSNRGLWQHLKKDGEQITVNIFAYDFVLDKKDVRLILSNDVTEVLRAEEKLRLSEEKYRLLFYSNPLPMWIFEKNTLHIIDVNDAAISQYGYSRDEFVRMNARDLRDPEDVERFTAFATSKRNIQESAGVWRHKRKDGSFLFAEVFAHDILFDGRPGRLVLANEITEKLEAERKLRDSYAEIRTLATHLQDVREEERAGIAREIHDELGQHLTGLKMDVSWISKRINSDQEPIREKIKGIAGLLDDTVKIVRRISTELRPSILDDLGLIEAMEWQGQEFQRRSAIKVFFDSGIDDLELPGKMAIGIFRIYQESLTNVARHAFATEVHTTFNKEDGRLMLRIKDNGAGFDVSSIGKKKTLGLLGMKERTLILGGTYEITSSPGNGTLVSVTVPLHQTQETISEEL
jgi:PAS domain S-box-containing protein